MRRLLLCVGMLLAGCGDEASETPGGTTPPPETPAAKTDHVGAWYGQGREFPDGDLCLLLCDNGRAFAGDRPCTDTAAGDFLSYYTYTRTGDAIELRKRSGTTEAVFTLRSLSGDTGTFIFQGVDLPMSRTAPTSALCTDASRTAY